MPPLCLCREENGSRAVQSIPKCGRYVKIPLSGYERIRARTSGSGRSPLTSSCPCCRRKDEACTRQAGVLDAVLEQICQGTSIVPHVAYANWARAAREGPTDVETYHSRRFQRPGRAPSRKPSCQEQWPPRPPAGQRLPQEAHARLKKHGYHLASRAPFAASCA